MLTVVRDPAELAAHAGCAFVPTMGALHRGHLALVKRAVETGRPVLVSIFVNPTQFGPSEDFARYPRTLERDLAAAEEAGASLAFTPDVDAIYPQDEDVPVPPLPAVATEPGLEDQWRPGHLQGVAQVVARLFDLVRPIVAVFGEKDYQQLRLVEAMARAEADRWPGLEIIGHPTVRESDGLALSSRNAYIDDEQRPRAKGLYRALQGAASAQQPATAERMMMETLAAHDLDVQYAVVRDAETLMPVSSFERPTRGLIAAKLGDIRLIDNLPLPVWR